MTDHSTRYPRAQIFSVSIGVITGIAGVALLWAPERAGALIGITSKSDARLVGAIDLALVPGLIGGRPQWPWLAARALSNPPTALFALGRAGEGAPRRRARLFSAVLAVATVVDLRVVQKLRQAGEPTPLSDRSA